MSWFTLADEPLIELLRRYPDCPESAQQGSLESLFTQAELHGVTGVVSDVLVSAGHHVDAGLRARLDRLRVARELDHAAHLAMLARIDLALADAQRRAVVLKGALFGERYYPRPSARATSDIDLLVAPGDLADASKALSAVGYVLADDAEEQAWSLREHHHLHFGHHHALPLELHFHAYRGLGGVLPSEPLLARSRAVAGRSYRALRVLAPEDELMFLAVHGAAHRFVRLGWLHDIRLLLETMTPEQIAVASARAEHGGFARPMALAAVLLREVLHVDPARLVAFPRLGTMRDPLLRNVVTEPKNPVLRSATRFLYTTALCDSARGAVGYASRSSRAHARRLLASLR